MLTETKAKGQALVFSVAAVLAICGCTADNPDPLDAAPSTQIMQVSRPNSALVNWVSTVCGVTDPRNDRLPAPFGPREDEELGSYLSMAPGSATSSVLQLKTLPPSRIRGGDEFAAAVARGLKAVRPELQRLAQGADSLPVEAKRERVRQARELLAAVKPNHSDLVALVAGDPALARAYELAPLCDRTTPPQGGPPSDAPMPTAADGSDVSACLDESCEISVSGPTKIVVGNFTFSVTKVTADRVTLRPELPWPDRDESPLEAGSVTTFEDTGIPPVAVGIRVRAVNGGTAVLRISGL